MRHFRLCRVFLSVTLVVAAVGVVLSSTGATASSSAPTVPAHGLLFGAAVHNPAGSDIAGLEKSVGRTLAIHRVYSLWNTVQPTDEVRTDAAVGRVTLLSIRPQLIDGSKISWASVAAGAQDAQIRAQIEGLRALGRPILLAFHHEADLSSGYGTAAQFRAAFRQYVDVARATGETTISFVVILATSTYGSAVSSWYPGDDVVDWAGADTYNFAACSPGRLPWRSFATAVASFRAWGASHDKPQVLAEWGSAEDPSVPGRKAQWITDAGTVMGDWPQLHAASYFDESDSCDWQLSTSSSALNAFRTLARSGLANGGPTARLSLTGLTSGGTASWTAVGSTGTDHVTGDGVASWSFDAGDATTGQGSNAGPGTIRHTYGAAGTYTATLTICDRAGVLATTQSTIRVS